MFARYVHFGLEDVKENRLNDELMWCLVVFQHDLHGQCLSQGKEKLLLKHPLFQKGKLFTSASDPLAWNRTKPTNTLV